ncbi:MAG: InlB B-repeat-containing protein, partial [Candidatus Coproplasma sp.]
LLSAGTVAGTVTVVATSTVDTNQKGELTITVEAASTPEPDTYTITWEDEDGTELEKDTNVAKGAIPSYDGATPTKDMTVDKTYTFAGWTDGVNTYDLNDALPAVTGDVTYTAVYSEAARKYTVTWKNYDGTVLYTAELEYGATPEYVGETPTKAEDAQYTYEFNGWDMVGGTVTGEMTYTAEFIGTIRTYTVTWQNEDGTELETDTEVEYGTKPSYDGAEPTKAADAEYSYRFDGWTDGTNTYANVADIPAISGNATYTAVFTAVPVDEFSVSFNVQNHGTTPQSVTTSNKQIPAPTAPTAEGYTFGGWYETAACDGEAIDFETKVFTADTTLYAKWTVIEYTVTFMNGEEVVGTRTYTIENKVFTAPDVPEKTGYNGVWVSTDDLDELGDKTFNAVYTAIEYNITYELDGGINAERNIDSYTITTNFTFGNPTKDGYRFDGWYNGDTLIQSIAQGMTGDITLTAHWVQQFTLTIKDKSGATLGGETLDKDSNINLDVIKTYISVPTGYEVWKAYTAFTTDPDTENVEYVEGALTEDTEVVLTFVLTEDGYKKAFDDTLALTNVTVAMVGETPTTVFAADGTNIINAIGGDIGYRAYSEGYYYNYISIKENWYKQKVSPISEGDDYDAYVYGVMNNYILGDFRDKYSLGTYDDKNDIYIITNQPSEEQTIVYTLTIADGKVTKVGMSVTNTSGTYGGTYTITAGGAEVTLPEAEEYTKFAELAQSSNNIIAENFNSVSEMTAFGGTYGNKGVYVKDSNYTIADGVLDVGNTTANTSAIVDFGIVDGIVEGYFEFKFLGTLPSSGNGNSINFYNGSAKVLTIMGHASGAVYTIEGIPDAEAQPTTTIKCDNTTLNTVYFKFDLANKTVSLVLNGEEVCTDLACSIGAISGFEIITSNSGKRHCVLDNVAVNATITYGVQDYQNMLCGDLQSLKDIMDSTHTMNADAVAAAYSAGDEAIRATADCVSAKKAYDNAVKALNAIADDYQQTAINYIETQYPAANYTQNKTAYDAQIALIKAESDPAKLTLPSADPETPAGETLATVLTAIAAIDNDETCYNAYAAEQIDALKANYSASDYKINESYYKAIVDALSAPAYETSYTASVEALATYLTEQENALKAIETDATVIGEAINAGVTAELKDYKSAEIAALEDEGTKTYLTDKKAEIIAAITVESIMADENYATNYNTLIITAITNAKTAIDSEYSSATKTLSDAIAEAQTAYANYVAAEIEVVAGNDSAFAATLTADDTKPTADFSSCETSAQVLTALDDAKADFDTWLSAQLAAKKYTITVHYGERSTTVEVAYGAQLTEVADPTDDDGTPVYMLADDKIYSNAECTTEYTSPEVYANGDVYLKVVEAVVMPEVTNTFNYSELGTFGLAAKDLLTQVHFNTASNSFITIGSNVAYRPDQKNCIQVLKNTVAFSVEFTASGTLVLGVRGTAKDQATEFYLEDKNNVKVEATYTCTDCTANDKVYNMYSSDFETFTFNVPKAGTYSFVISSNAAYDCRINSIVQTINPYKVAKVEATKVEIGGSNKIVVGEGKDITLTATITPDNATYKDVTWAISSIVHDGTTLTAAEEIAAIATIADGVLTLTSNAAIGDQIVITATAVKDDITSAAYTVTVIAQPVETVVVGVDGGGDAQVETGTTLKLVATVGPEDAVFEAIVWAIDGEISGVSISEDGVLTVAEGVKANTEITVTATAGGVTGTIVITAVAPVAVTEITITDEDGKSVSEIELNVGDTKQLKVELAPSGATNKSVTWSIEEEDKKYLTVSADGLLTAVSPTEDEVSVTVTATAASGVNKTVSVTVKKVAVESVTITGADVVVVGKTITLTATVTPDNATNKTVTWAVTDGTGSATIDENTGVLTGVSVGTVTVTATVDGVTSESYGVTVNAAPTVESVTVTAADDATSVTSGGTLQLFATVNGDNEPSQEVTWSIKEGDTTGSSVSESGLLTAGTVAGDVTIVATSKEDDEKYGEITIEVNIAISKLYPGSIARTSNAVLDLSDENNNLITVSSTLKFAANSSGKNGETANINVSNNKSLTDDDGNQFKTVGVTSDSCKSATATVLTIKAQQKDVKVTLYLNGCDSKYTAAKEAIITHSLSDTYNLTVGTDLDKVYKLEVTIPAENSCTISMDTTNSGVTGYLAVFAIYAQTV